MKVELGVLKNSVSEEVEKKMEKVRFETKGVLQQQLTFIEETTGHNHEHIHKNQHAVEKFELQIQLMQEEVDKIKKS